MTSTPDSPLPSAWQMSRFIAHNSVDESTPESVWRSHSAAGLEQAYERLRRDPAATEPPLFQYFSPLLP